VGRHIIDASILISHIGFCCAYLIFITENLAAIFHGIDKEEWLAMILPVMFILSLIPDLSKLAIFSIFAQVNSF
jgi:proton-coupled amino acid transporter